MSTQLEYPYIKIIDPITGKRFREALMIIWSILAILYVFFILAYSQYMHSNISRSVEEHSLVIESSLWSYSPTSHLEYLKFSAKKNNYEEIIIVDDKGDVFLQLSQDVSGPVDRLFKQLFLLPTYHFSEPVLRQGEVIGELNVVWRSHLIYLYLLAFMITLITGIALSLMVRLTLTRTVLFEKTQELQKSKNIADVANRSKTEFLANMSHEIRTPMNAIISLTDITLEGELTEKQRNDLEKVSYSSNYLLYIINDILDLSKIEAGKLELEIYPFSLQRLIWNVKSICEVRAHEKDLEFRLNKSNDIPDVLCGDELRLNQVLLNICGNAIKFTETGNVNLSFEVNHKTDEKIFLKISVSDTGVGMDDYQIERIFNAFQQADNSITRRYGGTGLGLSISRKLVSIMQGEIDVVSKKGAGTLFEIVLPFDLARKGVEVCSLVDIDEGDIQYDFSNYRILVVEDNDINQYIAQSVLEKTNIKIDFANDGVQAVSQVKKKQYDLILMDIQMPNMDGYEAARCIRMLVDYKKTPIFAMTAHAMDDDIKKCRDVGMNEHLSKPINRKMLLAKLNNWLVKGESKDLKDILNIDDNQQETTEITNYKISDYINREEGLNRLSGNEDLYVKVLESFLKGYKSCSENLHILYVNKQYIEFNKLIHEIKGVSGNMALAKLFEMTSRINDVRKQNPEAELDIDKYLTVLDGTISTVENYLESRFKLH